MAEPIICPQLYGVVSHVMAGGGYGAVVEPGSMAKLAVVNRQAGTMSRWQVVGGMAVLRWWRW